MPQRDLCFSAAAAVHCCSLFLSPFSSFFFLFFLYSLLILLRHFSLLSSSSSSFPSSSFFYYLFPSPPCCVILIQIFFPISILSLFSFFLKFCFPIHFYSMLSKVFVELSSLEGWYPCHSFVSPLVAGVHVCECVSIHTVYTTARVRQVCTPA